MTATVSSTARAAVLNDLAVGEVLPRCHAGDAFETARQMALIAEPGLQRRIGDRLAAAHQFARVGDAQLQLIFVRRQSGLLAKDAQEGKRTESRDCAQLRERDLLRKVLFQIRADERNRAAVLLRRDRRK